MSWAIRRAYAARPWARSDTHTFSAAKSRLNCGPCMAKSTPWRAASSSQT